MIPESSFSMRFSKENQTRQMRWLASGTLGNAKGFVEDESEIQEMDIYAFRNGLACSCQVGKSN